MPNITPGQAPTVIVHHPDPTSWICGLMAENYDAVGFLPRPTIQQRYVAQHQYVLQTTAAGRPVGYLLHGALHPGTTAVITQHLIRADQRLRGYGEAAIATFLARCETVGVASVRLRCATDLLALAFWQHLGWQMKAVVPGGAARRRTIAVLTRPCLLPMESLWQAHRQEDDHA